MKLGSYLRPYTNLNSKRLTDLKGSATTVKLFEENKGQPSHAGFGDDFRDMTLKAQ